MFRSLLPALTLGALLALAGCTAQPEVVPGQASAATIATTPPAVGTSFTAAEQAFLVAIANEPSMSWGEDDETKLRVGHSACTSGQTHSREQVIAEFTSEPNPWPLPSSTIIVDQAKAHLCPEMPWGATAAVENAQPAPAAGPLKDISSRDWALIAKSPDAHFGERVIVYGHVTQFDAATGTSGFRANVDGDKHNRWYDYDTNTVLTGTETLLAGVVQGDLFRAEVTVAGSYSYSTTLNATMTVPQLSIGKIDVIGSANT